MVMGAKKCLQVNKEDCLDSAQQMKDATKSSIFLFKSLVKSLTISCKAIRHDCFTLDYNMNDITKVQSFIFELLVQ